MTLPDISNDVRRIRLASRSESALAIHRPSRFASPCSSVIREQNIPLAIHLAESCEELELLASASGAMVEMLRNWMPGIPVSSRGLRPMHYLEMLAGASRAFVSHGNFLTTEEIQFLGDRAATMSVVYCPRTRAFFHPGSYPLSQMLEIGVNVALGTDSRASIRT